MFVPDKEEKKKRIINACNKVDSFFSGIIDNKSHIAYLVLFIHFCLISSISLYIIFAPINKIYLIIIVLILLVNFWLLMYYGGNGCIFTRLERYFFEDKNWNGVINIYYYLANIPIDENTKLISEFFWWIIWMVALIIIIYRIYTHYNEKCTENLLKKFE